MKTLLEIIEEVKDGKKPEYDELRYAMLALDYLHTDYTMFLNDMYGKNKLQGFDKMKYEQKYKQRQTAFSLEPKKYVGSFDPDLPEYQSERAVFKKIYKKFADKEETERESND